MTENKEKNSKQQFQTEVFTKENYCSLKKTPNTTQIFLDLIKFGYSEKATKFEKIFLMKFEVTE